MTVIKAEHMRLRPQVWVGHGGGVANTGRGNQAGRGETSDELLLTGVPNGSADLTEPPG